MCSGYDGNRCISVAVDIYVCIQCICLSRQECVCVGEDMLCVHRLVREASVIEQQTTCGHLGRSVDSGGLG